MNKLLLLLLTAYLPASGQIDKSPFFQQINDSVSVVYTSIRTLVAGSRPKTESYLTFRNSKRNDSTIVRVDSIRDIPCGGANFIFFLDEQTGFISASGGCYGFVHYLYKTTNGGKSWTEIALPGSDQPISQDHFFMFDAKKGILIRKYFDGNVSYATTSDGGLTWTEHTVAIDHPGNISYLSNVFYASSGQVTIVLSDTGSVGQQDKGKVKVIRSDDFGEHFRELK